MIFWATAEYSDVIVILGVESMEFLSFCTFQLFLFKSEKMAI